MKRGLILAAIQLALAMSVVAKFQYDRQALPRQWMKAEPFDPYLPLRGRYVQLRLRGADGAVDSAPFFIAEGVKDPSIRARDEELWVEVSLPKEGPPRPIRLAVRKNGVMTPLDLR